MKGEMVMGYEKMITSIVERGLRSPNCILSKVANNGIVVQIFKNPKTNAAVVKHIDPKGIVRTCGYSGKQNIMARVLPITLETAPYSVMYHATPKKFVEKYLKGGIYDFLSDEMRIASNGKETKYYDFFGRWVKGASYPRTMEKVMDSF